MSCIVYRVLWTAYCEMRILEYLVRDGKYLVRLRFKSEAAKNVHFNRPT